MAEQIYKDSLAEKTSKALALWEIASVVTSGLIAGWVVLSFVGNSKLILAIPILLALGLMFYSHRERHESLREIGFRLDNFVPAFRLVLAPTLAVILIILAAGWLMNGKMLLAPWRPRFLLLPIWALFQQYVLNGFINRRAQIGLGKGWRSIVLVGMVFGLLHLPNPLLVIMTILGGLIWGAVYQRHPNLYVLAISHSMLAITLAFAFPKHLLNSLRVGFKYFG